MRVFSTNKPKWIPQQQNQTKRNARQQLQRENELLSATHKCAQNTQKSKEKKHSNELWQKKEEKTRETQHKKKNGKHDSNVTTHKKEKERERVAVAKQRETVN